MSNEPLPGKERPLTNHAHSPARAWQVFKLLIKKKNLRVTQARRIIFNEVFSRHDHFSVDELADGLSRGEGHVSRSTVYSTLSLLVEAGLVGEICDRHGRVRYEHTFGHPPHAHMICEECGGYFEFGDESLARQINAECRTAGFVPRGHRITVFGACRRCSRKKGPDTSPSALNTERG